MIEDWQNYADHAWSWSWLPRVFPSSQRVRPADMDGWVEQGGIILMLDGKVSGGGFPTPNQGLTKAVRSAGNITALMLRTSHELWDIERHLPKELTHYYLLRGPWPAPAWQWERWSPCDLETAVAIVSSWAAWAFYHGDEPR